MHAFKKSTTRTLSCFFLTVILITTTAGIVKAFQRQPVSGIVIAEAKTDEKVKPLKEGDSNDDVVTLQESLRELNLYVALTTGYYGPMTTKAVKDFQKKHQLSQNGVADAITQTAIENALNALCKSIDGDCYYEEASYGEPKSPEINSDGFELNVAQKLTLGQGEEVRFTINNSPTLKEKLAGLRKHLDLSVGGKSELTKIRVKLSSSQSENFEINPKEATEELLVEENALWQWNIKPQKIGEKDLFAQVFVVYKDPEKSGELRSRSIGDLRLSKGRLYSTVQVEANLFQRLELFVQQLDWFVKLVFGVGATAVIGILVKLKELREAFASLNLFKKRPAAAQSVDVGGKKPDDENN